MEDIVAEARALADGGVKEIILVAQDVTKYGTDLYGSSAIVPLVQQLSKIDGIRWIRLLYCYPELVTDALVDEIATNDKVVKYIDIPLQHVDDRILRAMNRRSNSADINALFEKLQQKNIAARTTFICGFPSETAETHKAVVEFLQKFRLKNAGFFAYSREEGTAAYNLPAQVPAATKNKYVKNLYAVQHKVVEDNNLADVGTTQQVLIDELVEQTADGFVYIARNQYMCPEIDGVVYVHSQTALEIGEFYSCRITDALEYDLVGDKI
jgi:ribosomal protein S12 methylthiotransferase